MGVAMLGTGRRVTGQPSRVHRIGVLTPGELQWDRGAFLAVLNQLGYLEGRDFVLDVRSADGDLGRLPSLAAALVAARPDLLIGVNSPGTQELFVRKADLPLIAGNVGDPVGLGVVTNLARPDKGVTGVTNLSVDMTVKRLTLLAQVVPNLRRVALFLHPDDPVVAPQLEALQGAAAGLAVELAPFAMRTQQDLREALALAAPRQIGAVLRLAGQAQSIGAATGRLATESRLPSMLIDRASVEAGGLMAYFAHYGALWEALARQTEKVFRGEPVSGIPFETPTRFEFVLNLKAARQLGLSLPLEFLAQADAVFE